MQLESSPQTHEPPTNRLQTQYLSRPEINKVAVLGPDGTLLAYGSYKEVQVLSQSDERVRNAIGSAGSGGHDGSQYVGQGADGEEKGEEGGLALGCGVH